MNLLTFPLPVFRRVLRTLARGTTSLSCLLGTSQCDGLDELLVGFPALASGRHLLVALREDLDSPPDLPPYCAAVLTLGAGRRRGQLRGFVRTGRGREPLHHLKLVGPGMHTLTLAGTARATGDDLPTPDRERWSRSIAALGEDVWRRLRGLHYGIAGVGRSGSILAEAMAAGWGAQRLSLIDPDLIQTHNLGEMMVVTAADRGALKAPAVAEALRRRSSTNWITAVVGSVTHLPALRALQACDVLFGCLDHDSGRLAVAVLAVLFCKPYLDVATGIHGSATRRRMGADVRLLVPGERCLLCLGGLADRAGGRRVLTSADAEQAFHAHRDWRQERSGSLLSLNHLAAALALRLWEDFVAQRLPGSTWLHAEFDSAGQLTLTYSPRAVGSCPLCMLLGRGEEGLAQGRVFFQQEAPS
jgi:hypothetical protein